MFLLKYPGNKPPVAQLQISYTRIVPTNEYLFRWKILNLFIFIMHFTKNNAETIEHLFMIVYMKKSSGTRWKNYVK